MPVGYNEGMSRITQTILETLLILALGTAAGFGLNAVRGRDSIALGRDYNPPLPPRPTGTQAAGGDPTARVTADPANGEPERPFQEVSFEDVVKLWEDPKHQLGLYVLVDARNDRAFAAGHIPGAVQCDYYRIEQYLDTVVPAVLGAERVVVYCNGADCEDSLRVCGALLEFEVPWDRIFLYKGGWAEWHERGMPAEATPE